MIKLLSFTYTESEREKKKCFELIHNVWWQMHSLFSGHNLYVDAYCHFSYIHSSFMLIHPRYWCMKIQFYFFFNPIYTHWIPVFIFTLPLFLSVSWLAYMSTFYKNSMFLLPFYSVYAEIMKIEKFMCPSTNYSTRVHTLQCIIHYVNWKKYLYERIRSIKMN